MGSELELMPAAGFPLPTGNGALHNDNGIAMRNIDYQGPSNTTTNAHPSRVPRITGCRRRFDEGADALLDDRFTPPAGVPAAPEGAVGVSAVTCSDLDFAASAAAVPFSASLAATSCYAVVLTSIDSRARSACARYA